MTHARSQHPNAVLTPAGRRRMVACVLEKGWTIEAAVATAVPADVLTASLYTRFRSRQEHTFAEKTLSAMRQKFGGHVEPKKAAGKIA